MPGCAEAGFSAMHAIALQAAINGSVFASGQLPAV
jgi:hypothetical protein